VTLEADLFAALQAQCPRTFPDVAPVNTPRPYVVWQQVGGPAPVYLEGALPNKVAAYVQITVWDDERKDANALMRSIEAALVASNTLQARPLGGLIGAIDDGNVLRGCHQDFEIWAAR
jgi:hypothetical protein